MLLLGVWSLVEKRLNIYNMATSAFYKKNDITTINLFISLEALQCRSCSKIKIKELFWPVKPTKSETSLRVIGSQVNNSLGLYSYSCYINRNNKISTLF